MLLLLREGTKREAMSDNRFTSYLQDAVEHGSIEQMRQFQHQCRICFVGPPGLRRCSRCQVAYYCSEAHQRLDWKKHRLECRSIHQLASQQLPAVYSSEQSQSQGFYQQTQVAQVGAGGQGGEATTSYGGAGRVDFGGASALAQPAASGVRAEILSTNGVHSTNTSAMMVSEYIGAVGSIGMNSALETCSAGLLPTNPPCFSLSCTLHSQQNQQQQSPASTSSATVQPSSSAIVDVEDELLLNESAVSKLFAADSLAEVQELLELDQIDVDHILNENNFLNNINNLNFLDSVDNNNLLGFDSGVCDGDDGSVLGGNNNGTAGYVIVLDEDTDMQLTQTAMAATLQQQQLKLIGTGSSNNSNGVGSVVSTDESVSALLNAKIDNLLGLGGIGTTAGSGPVSQDAELADLEQESLDEACRNLIRDMNEYGVCVLDNFLGQDRGVKVLQEVTGMYSSGVFRVNIQKKKN